MAFHHPEVRIGGLDDCQAFVDIAPVQAVHGQDDGEKQAYADDGGNEPAFVEFEVVNGQIH